MAGPTSSERTVDYLPLHEIVRAPRNPKMHHTEGIAASIGRFGVAELPLLDERTGRLVAGHGRLDDLAARAAAGEDPPDGVRISSDGTWLVPVVRGWASRSDADADAYLIASNQLTVNGGWDETALGELLAALNDLDPDLLAVTGFGEEDLADLLAASDGGGRGPAEGLTDPDDVPNLPVTPVSKLGDLWLLGEHRLYHGDAMRRESYATLLGDERPDLLVTDPPYGVGLSGGDTGGNSIHGDLTQAAIPVSLALCADVLADDARVYLFGGSGNWPMYLALFDVHLRMLPRAIIWVKESFILRRNGYHSQFEVIYYGWKGKGGGPDYWYGDRTISDVWQLRRDLPSERVHPTQKPVEACSIPIRNSCPPGGLVLEPFGGSGSTLIAAHRLGRRTRVIELDGRFVDVICRRWQEHTGDLPVLESTGQPVDFATGLEPANQ